MDAAAGSALEQDTRRLRELIDAAALNAPVGQGQAEARTPSRSRPSGRGAASASQLPPTIHSQALVNLFGCVAHMRRQHALASAAWVEPLLRYGIVPAAAALLQHLLRANRHNPGCFDIAGAALLRSPMIGAPLASAYGGEASRLYSAADALGLVVGLVATSSKAMEAAIDAPSLPSARTADAASRLWGQLAAPATLQALADAVRWVEAEVWSSERAAAVAVGGALQPEHPPSNMLAASQVLFMAAGAVRSTIFVPKPPAGGVAVAAAAAASPAAATTARQLALLAALKESGALSALCAAVLAAPPCPAVAPDADALDDATLAMGRAQVHVVSVLRDLTATTALSPGLLGPATELLAAPDVQRLRWAALEQLAAAAPPTTDAFAAGGNAAATAAAEGEGRRGRAGAFSGAGRGGSGASGGRGGGGGGSGGGAADGGGSSRGSGGGRNGGTGGGLGGSDGSAGGGGTRGEAGGCALVLLQPNVVRLHPGMGGRLVFPYKAVLAAAIEAPFLWLSGGGDAPASATGAAPPSRAGSMRAAGRLLPPPRRLAALAAACCRAVCAEMEAEVRQLTSVAGGSAGTEAAAASGVGSEASRELCSALGGLLTKVALSPAKVAEADAATCLPDLLEAVGWALRAQVVAMAAVDGGEAAARGERSYGGALACNGAQLANAQAVLLLGQHDWKVLGAAPRATIVQRLLPTRLMQSLDCLLRRRAAAGLRTAEDSEDASSCMLPLLDLFPSLFHARAAVALGGGGGGGGGEDCGGSGWRPQDDLGLLVSAAKVARREAEQPGAFCLTPGPSGLERPHAENMAKVLATATDELSAMLVGRPPTAVAPHAWGLSSGGALLEMSGDAATAVLEAVALAAITALPALEQVVARDVGGGAGGGAGGGGVGRSGAGPGGGGGRASRRGDEVGSGDAALSQLATVTTARCARIARFTLNCLTAAVLLLPPADLLALQPQRTLALLGRLLQRAKEVQRRRAAGRGSRGGLLTAGAAYGMDEQEEEDELPGLAGMMARVLVHMAAGEQLVGAVAGWLRGEAAEAQVVQPPCAAAGLDAAALVAALRLWNATAADTVARLQAAAGGGDAPSRAAAAGACSGGDGTIGLLAAARGYASPWRLAGPGGTPLQAALARRAGPVWPPRVLRMCGNPRCANLAGPAEADLPLRKCSGCRAVRYCGAGCQRQHWREGGHKEACAHLQAAAEGEAGG